MTSRAVVAGAGIAGLCAAAVLSKAFDHVLVVERDELPHSPAPRRGVPQGDQLHNLLSRAQTNLESIFPGFRDRLLESGAGDASVSDGTYVVEFGVRMPERPIGLRLMCATRPQIDHVALTFVRRLANVEILERAKVTGFRTTDGRMASVAFERRGQATEIPASVLVDAAGPIAHAVSWLERDHGIHVPTVMAKPDQWYVTTQCTRPAEFAGNHRFWLVFPSGACTLGALVSPFGSSQWHVSVNGRTSDRVPRTAEDLVASCAGLVDPAVHGLLARATDFTPVKQYRKINASWQRFDQVDGQVAGLFAIGDALASLNPLHGQGVSMASWEAMHLAAVIPPSPTDGDLRSATVEYFRRSSESIKRAWSLGEAIESTVVRGLGGAENTGLALKRLLDADEDVHRGYVEAWHLLRETDDLLALMTSTDRRQKEHDA